MLINQWKLEKSNGYIQVPVVACVYNVVLVILNVYIKIKTTKIEWVVESKIYEGEIILCSHCLRHPEGQHDERGRVIEGNILLMSTRDVTPDEELYARVKIACL